MTTNTASQDRFMSPADFLEHWQGHRRLTRRVIEAFPDDQLFTHSVGSMRSFGDIGRELLSMAEPMARGLVTGSWNEYAEPEVTTKAALLEQWDRSTKAIDELWPQIPATLFAETLTAFGQYTDTGANLMLYIIDNEIHHRGQGYVYLRGLGVEPPPFWERD
jgi:uncharacterized damage-inducible protein DinB